MSKYTAIVYPYGNIIYVVIRLYKIVYSRDNDYIILNTD